MYTTFASLELVPHETPIPPPCSKMIANFSIFLFILYIHYYSLDQRLIKDRRYCALKLFYGPKKV